MSNSVKNPYGRGAPVRRIKAWKKESLFPAQSYKEFRNQQEASKYIGSDQSNISKVLSGRARHTKGWILVYDNES